MLTCEQRLKRPISAMACTLGQHDGWFQTRPHCMGGMQILAASMHMYLGLSGAADSAGRRTPVDHRVHDDLDGVAVGEQVDDLAGVAHDLHRLDLLAVVAAVHHQRRRQAASNVQWSQLAALGLSSTIKLPCWQLCPTSCCSKPLAAVLNQQPAAK